MNAFRIERDSIGEVKVPADKLWGAQTQRSREYFSIGRDLIPSEMIAAYAMLKRASATANHSGGRLDGQAHALIVQVCDEILGGQHHEMFLLHVWMTGSGTQFNMNVNEVVSNRCCQLAGTDLGSKTPVHPNDHVNMSQSTNDSFPSAMYIAAALNTVKPLIIANLMQSIALMTDGCTNFRRFLVERTKPNLKRIDEYVERSLMLVTALAPVIGYDRASKIAHHAMHNDLTLKAAALELGFVSEEEFDRVVDPAKMVTPYVAAA